MEALDRDHRVTVVPYQKPGAPASAGLSVEQCESAAWALEPGDAPGQPRRRWRGAGAVNASLAVALALKLPLSLYELPGVRWAQERAYDLVAANRRSLPGDEPYCEQLPHECRWELAILRNRSDPPPTQRGSGSPRSTLRPS